jgi:unconventional prefoldin RPB5 interactor 1
MFLQVPFAGVAFMKGQIVHPNEVTVLLGDNWFVQCTASHAVGIVGRRQARSSTFLDVSSPFQVAIEILQTKSHILDVEKTLRDLESEFNLVKGKLGLSNELVRRYLLAF